MCTSLPCSWLLPTFQNAPYAEFSDIDFETPQSKRRREDGFKPKSRSSSGYCTKVIKILTQEELNSFFLRLAATGKPAIHSIPSGFSDTFVTLCMSGTILKLLTDLHNPQYLELSFPELLTACEALFQDYAITAEKTAKIVKHTHDEA